MEFDTFQEMSIVQSRDRWSKLIEMKWVSWRTNTTRKEEGMNHRHPMIKSAKHRERTASHSAWLSTELTEQCKGKGETERQSERVDGHAKHSEWTEKRELVESAKLAGSVSWWKMQGRKRMSLGGLGRFPEKISKTWPTYSLLLSWHGKKGIN